MNLEDFRKQAHEAVDWVADYMEQIESFPVKSQIMPREVYDQLPDTAPLRPEPFEQQIKDLNEIIMPGITHWQHPHFHAYFPANNSFPSIIAEILTAGIGAQCMVWETSPAAAELEERMMEWLQQAMQLPSTWQGVIQDTASTATLCALLTAREKVTGFKANEQGGNTGKILRVYCSSETHSSIEKGAKIAGIGSEHVVKIAVDDELAMKPDALEAAILQDLKNGYTPCCVVTALGTTGTLAFDPTEAIGRVCKKHQVWLHVDAAYAGSAMILPEMNWLRKGLEYADSFVFNPHKWLFTNFDCTAYYVKDHALLTRTFEILPEYLKTSTRGQVNDYRDWGIQLGRRFRALKLWMVMRSYGLDQMREILREHLRLTAWLEQQMRTHPGFEILTPVKLNVVVFRQGRKGATEQVHNQLNEALLQRINQSGKAYLTHTRVNGKYAIRLVLGQTRLEQRHVEEVWDWLQDQCV